MAIRTTLSHVARQAQMSMSRATIREFSDDHLMQEVKQADVYYSETPSDFERWQMVGMTSFPLKQEEDQKKKTAKKEPAVTPETNMTGKTDFNDDQPKGPAAEAVMLYLNGQRSHPVAIVDDRRVRPYEMSEGEGAHYAPDGSEQMVLFKENGTYIVSLDNTSVKDKKNKKTRFASLRHVNKKMQTHKIEDSKEQSSGGGGATPSTRAGESGGAQKKEKYKHEGDSVNTEVRVTGSRIEFRTGDKLVGHYDKGSDTWELYESGGNFRIIVSPSKVIGQYQNSSKSFRVDDTHTHIKFGSKAIWVDAGGCWSSQAIDIKPDNCS